jgi:hypothetical protein
MRFGLVLLLITFAAGCGNVRHTEHRWGEFESHRLSNGEVLIEVVPEIGRIVGYGYVGGPNVLWTDPKAKSHVVADWVNFGGDKVWLWPQDQWKPRTGKTWPPPGDGLAYTWKVDARTMTLTSPPIPGWDVRIVRVIEMDRLGTRVTITNTLEPVGPNPPKNIVLWQIAQVPIPDKLTAVARPSTLVQMDPNMKPWKDIKDVGAQLVFNRPTTEGAKVGFDGHQISALYDHTWFMFRMPRSKNGVYKPGERAQIFSLPDNDKTLPDGMPSYVELEYTAPSLPDGYAPLVVQWELK